MTEIPILILAASVACVAFDASLTRRSGGTWLAVLAGVLAMTVMFASAIGSGSVIGRTVPVLTYTGLVFGRERWVALIGLRPEVGLFTSYRRYYLARQTERTSLDEAERIDAHRKVVHELAELDRWRSENTAPLVELLRYHYALVVDPNASSVERGRVAAELDSEMIRVWGPPEGRGIHI